MERHWRKLARVRAHDLRARTKGDVVTDRQQVKLDHVGHHAWPEDALAHAGAEEAHRHRDTAPMAPEERLHATEIGRSVAPNLHHLAHQPDLEALPRPLGARAEAADDESLDEDDGAEVHERAHKSAQDDACKEKLQPRGIDPPDHLDDHVLVNQVSARGIAAGSVLPAVSVVLRVRWALHRKHHEQRQPYAGTSRRDERLARPANEHLPPQHRLAHPVALRAAEARKFGRGIRELVG